MGKRNKQAKDKQLSLATIVWSKVKFMTRDVAISRKGIQNPRKILLYLRGEKAHTSKRVSIIACNNVISKVQCAPCGSDIAFAVILSSTVILRCSDICPSGKLRIYLNFGVSRNITLTKSKYNLRSKYNFGDSQNITCTAI